jgi:hypothetical protein
MLNCVLHFIVQCPDPGRCHGEEKGSRRYKKYILIVRHVNTHLRLGAHLSSKTALSRNVERPLEYTMRYKKGDYWEPFLYLIMYFRGRSTFLLKVVLQDKCAPSLTDRALPKYLNPSPRYGHNRASFDRVGLVMMLLYRPPLTCRLRYVSLCPFTFLYFKLIKKRLSMETMKQIKRAFRTFLTLQIITGNVP